jgi:high frequency lysogenization protein
MYSDSDRVIALAGVFQSARNTWQLAHQGDANSAAMEASIGSLFQADPPTVAAVFGGVEGVESGLHSLIDQLDDPRRRSVEITQYGVNMLQLARKLRANKEAYTRLGGELDSLQARMESFNFEQSTRYAQLAEIYSTHISPLGPRIMVKGNPGNLENTANAARIRSILLAGIRAAHLWYQCGGKRWHLLVFRKRIVSIAGQMLKQLSEQREAA